MAGLSISRRDVLFGSRVEAGKAIPASISPKTQRVQKDALENASASGSRNFCRYTSWAGKFRCSISFHLI